MKKTWAPLLFAATVAMASPAMAATITTAPNFGPYNVADGGEFTVAHDSANLEFLSEYVEGKTKMDAINAFQTFCLERTQHISADTTYNYTLGVVTSTLDPISEGTAYLYKQFANGTLAGYNYDDGDMDFTDQPAIDRRTSARLLQQAFWYLEAEPDYLVYGGGNLFMDAVIGMFANPYASNNIVSYGVQAVRLSQLNCRPPGCSVQDVLYAGPTPDTQIVPDGGATLTLLGFALLGIAVLSRRFGLGSAR